MRLSDASSHAAEPAPGSTRWRPTRRARGPWLLAAGVLVLALAASGWWWLGRSAGAPTCEAQTAGFDPALEAQVPPRLEGKPPDRLDSGRHCTPATLGTLHDRHGLAEVTFAGGLWDLGPQTGVTIALFSAPGLQADWIAEFYEAGAAEAPKVTGLSVSHPVVAGSRATRLDYADAEVPEAIVVWPADTPGLVRVVLAAGVPDRIVQEAIGAFGS